MKLLGLFLTSALLFLTTGCAVNHTGLLSESHNLEVDANTVRVELRDFNNATVTTTGEPRNRQGELHSYIIALTARSEFFNTSYTTVSSDILNVSKGSRGGKGYVDIDVGDHMRFFDGNRTDDGELRLKPTPWVNARRGAIIELTLTARELDCIGQNVCNRDNTGRVTFVMTIPRLPDPLPTICQETNSFQGIQVDGLYRFDNMLDRGRIPEGSPIIEPGIHASGARLCFLPPE